MEAAIEVKAARKITSDHLKGLRHLRQDHPEVGRLVLVCAKARAQARRLQLKPSDIGAAIVRVRSTK